MKREALSQLKKFLKDQKLDFFLLPNSDEFFSEYLPESEKRIEYLTGFTGSSATVIFGQERSYFFTDGRYILQAKQQLDLGEFEIFNIAEKSVLMWLTENFSAGKKLALDAKLVSLNFVKSLLDCWTGFVTPSNRSRRLEFDTNVKTGLQTPSCTVVGESNLIFLEENPIDKIWKNHPLQKNSAVFLLNEKLCGLDSMSKRKQVLQGLEADAMIITKPENLCWLLNIRASDVEFTPLLLAYGILFKNGEVELFVEEKRCPVGGDGLSFEKVNLMQPNCFDLRIGVLARKIKKIQIDAGTTNYWLYELLQKNNFEISDKKDPIEILKSVKNKIEIDGVIKAHEADGLALTKFLFWLENSGEIDEILAEEKLLEFRKESPDFLYPSFASISAFASNGAVIHYRATGETNKKFVGNGPRNECGVTSLEMHSHLVTPSSAKVTSLEMRSHLVTPSSAKVTSLEMHPHLVTPHLLRGPEITNCKTGFVTPSSSSVPSQQDMNGWTGLQTPSSAKLQTSSSASLEMHSHLVTPHLLRGPEITDSLYLIDSGGQYFGENFCGTTDVTRTIAIGNPSSEMIENFTRVLKGHIALACTKFPIGTTGAQLDALARNHLWQAGLDYDHGTGHGVGHFLSVHEGPQGISKRAHQPLLPGMILSNEPGFYAEGKYGIRIENLMLVEKFDEKFLCFKTLTLAPIDSKLIDFKMLTRPEKTWLKEYHEMVAKVVGEGMSLDEKNWIKNLAEKFGNFCSK
jgi:Xaa-Pro aminopeptidase